GRRAGGFGSKDPDARWTNARAGSKNAHFGAGGRRGSDFAYGDGRFVSQAGPLDRRPMASDGVRQAGSWRDKAAPTDRAGADGRAEPGRGAARTGFVGKGRDGPGGSFAGSGRDRFSGNGRGTAASKSRSGGSGRDRRS
ncbi:MAG TPA: hypothetical protein PK177_21855, partial [Burkholderiaceae bacterium]|nr:hypothetical protein [Burkholderiaceae bacterium]